MYILKSLVGTLSRCQSRESITIKYTNLNQTTLFFGFYLSASRFNSTIYYYVLQLLYYLLFLFISNWNSLDYIIHIWYIILWSNFHSEYEIYLSNFIVSLYILKSFPLHKRDKITVQTYLLCSKQQGEQKGKIVSKRFQNYQSLPILQGCWKNWYIILLYICKIGVR